MAFKKIKKKSQKKDLKKGKKCGILQEIDWKINKNKQKLDTVGKEEYTQKHDFLRRFQENVVSEASKMVLARKNNFLRNRAKTFEIGSE